MKTTLLLLAAMALFFACEKQNTHMDVTYELGQPFTLAFNETGSCDCVAPDLRFVRVITESRCPSYVDCIWAGEVVVELNIDEQPLRLGFSPIDTAPAKDTLGMWSYALRAVHPYAHMLILDGPINESAYTLELVVEAI
jgi:hypothetical protein